MTEPIVWVAVVVSLQLEQVSVAVRELDVDLLVSEVPMCFLQEPAPKPTAVAAHVQGEVAEPQLVLV
jgi:hypothetical protein